MRGIFILVLFAIALIAVFGAPFPALLIWAWLSLMTPYKLAAGGWVGHFPFGWTIAAVTMGAWLFGRERKQLPAGPVFWLWAAFVILMIVSTLMALNPSLAWNRLYTTLETMLLGFAVAVLATNRARLQLLVWIMVLSLSYFGVKGGIFTILRGGHGHVLGPPHSTLTDNNYLALALCMILPFFHYLWKYSSNRLTRAALILAMIATIVGVLGTYSRGGLIGLAVMGSFFWWRSRRRVLIALLAFVVLIPAINLMPAEWSDRVGTLRNATEQQTFRTRVDAWRVAYHLALARPLTGGGFGATENPDVYRKYSFGQSVFKGDRSLPEIQAARRIQKLNQSQIDQIFPSDFTGGHAVHSIYFQVLADHGFLGLTAFVLLMAVSWLQLNQLRRQTRHQESWIWASDLASMIQVSMVAFFAAGSAVSLPYYDLPYMLIGASVAMRREWNAEKRRASPDLGGPYRWKQILGTGVRVDVPLDQRLRA